MTSAQAILIGACLIAGSAFFASSIRPAEAQRVGPFQIMQTGNTTASPGVFRVDTATGEMTYCYVTGPTGDITCSKSAR